MSGTGDDAASRLKSLWVEHGVAIAASARDQHAALALALHLHTLTAAPPSTPIRLTCIATHDQDTTQRRGLPTIPSDWSRDNDVFTFQYEVQGTGGGDSSSSPAQPRLLVIKSMRMDDSLLVHAAVKQTSSAAASTTQGGQQATASSSSSSSSSSSGSGNESLLSLELNVSDHIQSSAFPSSSAASTSSSLLTDPDRVLKDATSLIALYDRTILHKAIPELAPTSGGGEKAGRESERGEEGRSDPLMIGPRGPYRPTVPPIGGDEGGEEGYVDPHNPLRRPRGDFAGDLDPLTGGPRGVGEGGMLMGPRNFPGLPGNRPQGPPGMAPRFDPYGPVPGMGNPDFDELPPPGPGGPNPLGGIGGPMRRGGGRGGRGGGGLGGFGSGRQFPGMGGGGGGGWGGGFGGGII